jgi:hypothetical protein
MDFGYIHYRSMLKQHVQSMIDNEVIEPMTDAEIEDYLDTVYWVEIASAIDCAFTELVEETLNAKPNRIPVISKS